MPVLWGSPCASYIETTKTTVGVSDCDVVNDSGAQTTHLHKASTQSKPYNGTECDRVDHGFVHCLSQCGWGQGRVMSNCGLLHTTPGEHNLTLLLVVGAWREENRREGRKQTQWLLSVQTFHREENLLNSILAKTIQLALLEVPNLIFLQILTCS